MAPKDVQHIETIGSPFIGFYDLLMINTHYNCFEKCKGKATTKCQNYGFVNPRNCSKCVCPSGYGGDYCDKRPPGCGAELDAAADWKPLLDEVGNRTAGDIIRLDFMKCNYWIKAPIGKKIEVKTVSFTDGVAVDGCTYAGVEIKTHSNQGLSGYRFCTWNYTTVLKSELNMQCYAEDIAQETDALGNFEVEDVGVVPPVVIVNAGEAVHMSKDFALICEKEFHAREIGIFLTKAGLSIDHDVMQRRTMLENSKKIVSELCDLLAADRTPGSVCDTDKTINRFGSFYPTAS
ncbi:hypothetical protein GCK32_001952 [Trichostrongylus colubriformis]|uniref:Peptidase M12A domain-containing protein n=1 Tax=Trichostrongylus colubriformis TaxID=6319 RepID=A0AAN8FXY8_TRICO